MGDLVGELKPYAEKRLVGDFVEGDALFSDEDGGEEEDLCGESWLPSVEDRTNFEGFFAKSIRIAPEEMKIKKKK